MTTPGAIRVPRNVTCHVPRHVTCYVPRHVTVTLATGHVRTTRHSFVDSGPVAQVRTSGNIPNIERHFKLYCVPLIRAL